MYQLSVALTNIFLGVFGLYLIYRLLTKYFSEKVSLLTAIFLFGATNLLFYISVEPINSHAASFFISSLFVFYFLKKEAKKEKDYYLALGLLGGIAGLIRTQDLLILILPLIQILYNSKKDFKAQLTGYLQLVIGAFIGFLPQILLWKYFFNTFWFSPYLNTGFNLLKPQVFHVLFNTQNGLFTLTPIIAVSFIGLFLIKKRLNTICFYSLIYFLIQLYLISSWKAYFQGGSYSIRMLITTYPLLSFGLAGFISRIIKRYSEKFVLTLLLLSALVNSAFIINYLIKF
jgi:4-amino-4-deoxy-L-arabinose transferase-like glycosyltransferase